MPEKKEVKHIAINDRRMTISDTPKPPAIPKEGDPIDKILALAIQQGAPLDQLEKWIDLKRQYEADEARKAFYYAMAQFKKNPPEILKTGHVKYKTKTGSLVDYWHAELGEICSEIGVRLAEYDLFANWTMEQPDKTTIKTTCILSHAMGHQEKLSMSGPPDTSGGKDEIKAAASTNTTLQRLTLLAITGLAAKGMDVDAGVSGNGGIEYISTDQCIEIDDLIKETYKSDDKKQQWLEYMEVDSVKHIPADKHKMAINSLKRAKEWSKNA